MIIHASLITSIVPKSMKHFYITLIIKKTTLNNSNLSSYRPISQLSPISKNLERIVSAQLIINDLLLSLDNKAPVTCVT